MLCYILENKSDHDEVKRKLYHLQECTNVMLEWFSKGNCIDHTEYYKFLDDYNYMQAVNNQLNELFYTHFAGDTRNEDNLY